MPDESRDISLFEAIDTQRALRYIKPDPVPDEMLDRILRSAVRAPSGGNSQPWEFVVVRDPDVKKQIAGYYKRAWDETYGQTQEPGRLGTRSFRSAAHFAEHLAEAPLWIIVCLRHDGSPGTMMRGASIYPAVQNMLLTARALGLASVLTTLHARYEREVAAILGLPEDVQTAALLPFGFPEEGHGYGGRSRRIPLEEFLHFDRW